MRKSVFLTIFLLVFAAVSLTYAHGWVDKEKDTINIEETVIFGDKVLAEGLSINSLTASDYHLFWNTSYVIGEKPLTATTFDFSQIQKQQDFYFADPVFDVSMPFSGRGMSSNAEIDLEEDSFAFIKEPLKDVASRTADGERHKEQVYLKDYYDYYPLEVTFYNISMTMEDYNKTSKLFSDYFKIPVLADHKVEIEIKKNRSGEIVEINLSTVGENGVYTEATSVNTKDGCYFSLSLRSYDWEVLDPGLPSDRLGIYYIPYKKVGNESIPAADKMKMVFPLDAAQTRIIMLKITEDHDKLLLLTKENQTYFLRVIDRKTMTELQKIELLALREDEIIYELYVEEDFLVPLLSDGRFVVLSKKTSGEYEKKFSGNLSTAKEMWEAYSNNVKMDYNGTDLALLIPQRAEGISSFYVSVYQPQGLAFYGKYDNSLDVALTQPVSENMGVIISPITFSLAWPNPPLK